MNESTRPSKYRKLDAERHNAGGIAVVNDVLTKELLTTIEVVFGELTYPATTDKGVNYGSVAWLNYSGTHMFLNKIMKLLHARSHGHSEHLHIASVVKKLGITINRMSSVEGSKKRCSFGGMRWHCDNQPVPGTMALVYTFYTNGGCGLTNGGDLLYSNKPDGQESVRSSDRSRLGCTSNSLYTFFGSHVHHAVSPVVHTGGPPKSVIRYAIVQHFSIRDRLCRLEAKLQWALSCPGCASKTFCRICLETNLEGLVALPPTINGKLSHEKRYHRHIITSKDANGAVVTKVLRSRT
jgi:hypothetical protein